MLLSKVIRQRFSFNIINSIKNLKNVIRAPVKHIKSIQQPSGQEFSTQTNTTEEAFDEVSQEWQTLVASNPYDLQTFNYLQNAQLMNFGTVDNPLVIFTADAPFRYVSCTGPQNQDDYENHESLWFMLRQGPLQRCGVCGQVFKLVRLRNENTAEMDYYIPNFHPYQSQQMGQHDVMTLLSLHKMNTHYEYTHHQTPEDAVFTMVNPDEHDRILVDPAYRMQRLALAEQKAKVIQYTLQKLDEQAWKDFSIREPISKVDYENLIDVEVAIRKLDRNFRKVLKFESRKFTDPQNHDRREKRMLERAKARWDGAYTFYVGGLTEEEQKFKDYYETDLQNYKEDEVLEEYLDRQQLLSASRYNLYKYDFQEEYVIGNQDDQSSYVEKKIFKFKYRRALDNSADYERRQARVQERQKARFESQGANALLENYIKNPQQYEKEYLSFIQKESHAIYNDYFESDKDQNFQLIAKADKGMLTSIYENFQLPKEDLSTSITLKHNKWDVQKGWWLNVLTMMEDLSLVAPKLKAEIVEKNIQGLLEGASKGKDQPLVKQGKSKNKK